MAKKINQKEDEAAADVYIVVSPLTYGDPETEHAAGAEVTDVPPQSIPWLLEQGHIRLKEGN